MTLVLEIFYEPMNRKGVAMRTQEKNLFTWILVSIILLGIFLFWNSKAFGQEWTAEQKEVWEAVKANWDTLLSGDAKAAMEWKHEDTILWFSSRPEPLKKVLLESAYKTWFDYDKPISYELKPLVIHIFNNVANVFYLYNWKGTKISDKGRILGVWVKQDNKWKVIANLSSSCDKLPPCPYSW